MENNREYPRFKAALSVDFEYVSADACADRSGAPAPSRGHGKVVDISIGGAYITTDADVCTTTPIALFFKTMPDDSTKSKTILITTGEILRTGNADGGPAGGSRYLAVRFLHPQFNLSNMISAMA